MYRNNLVAGDCSTTHHAPHHTSISISISIKPSKCS